MLSLFGKQLEEIEYDDVVEFCEKQIPESIFLDYKRDFTGKDLAKTIASFANTVGGWLIFGVNDKDDKPQPPYDGMNYHDDLNARVNNIIIDNIWPYIRPAVKTCENKDKSKAFVVAYIPESTDSPHWTANKTKLYLRRNERTDSDDWSKPATSDQWEWLRDKSKNSANNRMHSKDLLTSLCNHLNSESDNPNLLGPTNFLAKRGVLSVYICPYHPSNPIMQCTQAFDALFELKSYDTYNTEFPESVGNRSIFDQGSYTFTPAPSDMGITSFFGLDTYGGILLATDISKEPSKDSAGNYIHFVRFYDVVSSLEKCIQFASSLYQQKNQLGTTLIEINFNEKPRVRLKFDQSHSPLVNHASCVNVRGHFRQTITLDHQQLFETNERYTNSTNILVSFLRSFGYTDPMNDVVKGHYSSRELSQQ